MGRSVAPAHVRLCAALALVTCAGAACFVTIPAVVEADGAVPADAAEDRPVDAPGAETSCADLPLLDPPDARCPVSPDDGPMVPVRWPDGGVFCIDATEIRSDDYLRVYLTPMFTSTFDGGACAAQSDPRPPPAPYDKPTLQPAVINWCEADAFCRYVGRRLCGGGGDKLDPAASEWFRACTPDGGAFPFGPDAAAGGCTYTPPLTNVGSWPCCVGSVRGLFDMSGNVAEWTSECGSRVLDGGCSAHALRGGSARRKGAAPDPARASCGWIEPSAQNTQRSNGGDLLAGARCCADPR